MDYICDVCRKQRGSDSNHWFLVTFGAISIIVTPWEAANEADIQEAEKHLCGQEHMLQVVSEWAAKRQSAKSGAA